MTGDDLPSESFSSTSPAVPVEYAGRWIAWNSEGNRIVASGATLREAAEAAAAASETHPIFAKVPKAEARFVGLQR